MLLRMPGWEVEKGGFYFFPQIIILLLQLNMQRDKSAAGFSSLSFSYFF